MRKRSSCHERNRASLHDRTTHYPGIHDDCDVRAYAQAVTCPTYLVHGDHDHVVSLAWAEDLARAIPSAYLEVMPEGSHTLMVRNAEARRRVIAFMRQTDMLSSSL